MQSNNSNLNVAYCGFCEKKKVLGQIRIIGQRKSSQRNLKLFKVNVLIFHMMNIPDGKKYCTKSSQ